MIIELSENIVEILKTVKKINAFDESIRLGIKDIPNYLATGIKDFDTLQSAYIQLYRLFSQFAEQYQKLEKNEALLISIHHQLDQRLKDESKIYLNIINAMKHMFSKNEINSFYKRVQDSIFREITKETK